MSTLPSVEQLNDLTAAAFADAAAPLFEGASQFLTHLAAARPFQSFEEMFQAARAVALAMRSDDQIELLNAHPRIGAGAGAMSALSRAEQGTDGLSEADPHVIHELAELNEAYEARFGFRFVIFVAGRPRSAVVPILEAALRADPADELRRGLDDVVSIAEDRLRRRRAEEETRPTIGA